MSVHYLSDSLTNNNDNEITYFIDDDESEPLSNYTFYILLANATITNNQRQQWFSRGRLVRVGKIMWPIH
jgi:hypothetical protein